MRAGKENGLLLPSTIGTSNQVLVSQGNGLVGWSDGLINAVTLNTTQTISGQKTFSSTTTNFGSSGVNTILNANGGSLMLQQSGATFGTTRLWITNENGQNGAIFEQAGSVDLVDFGFKTLTGQSNLRYERRSSSNFFGGGSDWEFQFGTPANPEFIVSDNSVTVKSGLTLRIGSSTVYHTGNIPGDTADVIYNNGSGLAGATNLQVESGGYLRLVNSMPASAAIGGVAIGARDLAGRSIPAFVDSSGLDSVVQPHLGRNRISAWLPIAGSSSAPTAIGISAPTATGTLTARTPASTSLLTSLSRVGYIGGNGLAGTLAGYRGTAQFWRGNVANGGGFFFSHTFAISDANTNSIATSRMFVGLSAASGSAPSNVQPDTLTNVVGLCKMSNSTNLQIIHNDNASTATLIDLGSNFPANTINTDIYRLTLYTQPNASSIGYRVERLNNTSITPVTGVLTTNLPVNTTFMGPIAWKCNTSNGGAPGIDLINLYVETDT